VRNVGLASPSARNILAAGLVLGSVAAASAFPPNVTAHALAPCARSLWQAYIYWCSMLAGAAPYIVAGSLAGAASCALQAVLERSHRDRGAWLRRAIPLFASLCSGCDCSLAAFAPGLQCYPVWLRGFTFVFSACCNPVSLWCTAQVLGPRLLLARVCGGFMAASLTALLWLCASRPAETVCAHSSVACGTAGPSIGRTAAAAFKNVGVSAAVAAVVLAFAPRVLAAHRSGVLAALAGALLSPCSSSDALLARALFRQPGEHAAFILGAQCFDVRQLVLLRRHFGTAAAGMALTAGMFATWCVWFIVPHARG
jgi:uncharacterized membrane protein YraQ (UPF0718 family)